jgi:hypothetical protein
MTPLESPLKRFNPPRFEGWGSTGTGVKRGAPLPHPQFFSQNFFPLLLTTLIETKQKCYISSYESGKVRKNTGLYRLLLDRKVILGIPV